MVEFFKTIKILQEGLRINSSQSLFLLAVYHRNFTLDLSNEDYLNLIDKKLIKNNILTKRALEKIDEITGKVPEKLEVNSDINYPQLSKQSSEIVKELGAIFLRQGIPASELNKLSSYFQDNFMMLPFMHLFFQMFPSSDSDKNKIWDQHFQTTYNGVTLRRVTAGTCRQLKRIWANKDIGAFLLGTYMYVRSTKSEDSNRYYVMKIENYLKDYKSYYEEAVEALEQKKSDMFNIRNNQTSNTIAI